MVMKVHAAVAVQANDHRPWLLMAGDELKSTSERPADGLVGDLFEKLVLNDQVDLVCPVSLRAMIPACRSRL